MSEEASIPAGATALPVPRSGPSRIRIAGAVLLFLAFVSQNAVLPLWSGRTRALERSQVLFDLELARRDLWTVALGLQLEQTHPDPAFIGRTLQRVLEANRDLAVWSAGKRSRNAPEHRQQLVARESQLRQAEALIAARNDASVLAMAATTAAETRLDLPRDDRRFFAALDALGERESFWFRIFLIAYATGSFLIAADVLWRRWAAGAYPRIAGGTYR